MINKIVASVDEAVADIFDGATVLFGGFGLARLRLFVKVGTTGSGPSREYSWWPFLFC